MQILVNLTPHPVHVQLADGTLREYPPSGQLARIDSLETACESAADIPCICRSLGACQIPALAESELGIVSSMVLEAAQTTGHPSRHRLVAPDTGPTALRSGGQVVAVTRLVRLSVPSPALPDTISE